MTYHAAPITKGFTPVKGKLENGPSALLCPKCSSYYITEQKCESCGLVFQKPRTQFFYDKDHFYNLRSDYLEQLPIWSKYFPAFENKKSHLAKEYKRRLLKRFKLICGAISEDGHRLIFQKGQDGTFLKMEFKELITEAINYDISLEMLSKVMGEWPYQDIVSTWIKKQIDSQFDSYLLQNSSAKDSFFKRSFFSFDNVVINNSHTKIIDYVFKTFLILLTAYFFLIYLTKKN